jgi:hypothetical protein
MLWMILFSEKVQLLWHIHEGGGNYVWGTANPWPRIPHRASKSSWCWYVRQYGYSWNNFWAAPKEMPGLYFYISHLNNIIRLIRISFMVSKICYKQFYSSRMASVSHLAHIWRLSFCIELEIVPKLLNLYKKPPSAAAVTKDTSIAMNSYSKIVTTHSDRVNWQLQPKLIVKLHCC